MSTGDLAKPVYKPIKEIAIQLKSNILFDGNWFLQSTYVDIICTCMIKSPISAT